MAIVLIVVGLFTLIAGAVMLYFGVPNKAGEFGDSFGVVNAFFSALALAGVIYAILLQQKEIEIQTEALKKTQNQIVDSNIELSKTIRDAILHTHPAEEAEDDLEMSMGSVFNI